MLKPLLGYLCLCNLNVGKLLKLAIKNYGERKIKVDKISSVS